jgi:protein-disulfide isomerase
VRALARTLPIADDGRVNDEAAGPEAQPEVGDDAEPASPAPRESPFELPPDLRRRPLWTYFLTPVAVVIGAMFIAGAVWYTNGENNTTSNSNSNSMVMPATQAAPESTSPANSANAAKPQDLLAAFNSYVSQVGMDQAKFATCLANKDTAAVVNRQLQRGAALGITGTPTFFINNKMLVGAQPAQIFDEIVQAELKGSPTTLDGYSASVKALAQQSPAYFQILDKKPDVSDAQFQGNPNAKVVIAEFSDFQCPFCKQWTDQNIGRVRQELGDNVAFAFLHFPITQIHPNAGNAALAAQCAAEQGKFWQMHDILFSRQAEWAGLQARNQ